MSRSATRRLGWTLLAIAVVAVVACRAPHVHVEAPNVFLKFCWRIGEALVICGGLVKRCVRAVLRIRIR